MNPQTVEKGQVLDLEDALIYETGAINMCSLSCTVAIKNSCSFSRNRVTAIPVGYPRTTSCDAAAEILRLSTSEPSFVCICEPASYVRATRVLQTVSESLMLL